MPNNSRQVIAQAKRVESATRSATRRALNSMARQATTLTKRTLSKEMGISQAKLKPYVSTRLSNYSDLSSAVRVKPHTYNIASFNGRQTKRGVSSVAWGGKPRIYPHTFLIHGITAMVRVGKARLPIRPVYGPRIHREFAQPAINAALKALVAAKLPIILEHELDFALGRIGMRR